MPRNVCGSIKMIAGDRKKIIKMIAGDRKKIIKMTQGERLFNVILIISVSWQMVVKSFRYSERVLKWQTEKIGVLLFRHLIMSEHLEHHLEHLKPPMNTRFFYTVPDVPYNIYKRVYSNNRMIIHKKRYIMKDIIHYLNIDYPI